MVESTYLFVLPWSLDNPGGVDQVIINLYRHFLEGGHYRPQLLLPSWEKNNPGSTTESGLPVVRLRVRSPLSQARTFRSFVSWPATLIPDLRSTTQFMRSNRVALVNVHFPSLGALHFILVKRLFMPRLKVILSFHGMDIVNAAATSGFERRLWRLLVRGADACVGNSDALTSAIREFEPRTARALTIHNGLDIEHLMLERDTAATLDPRLVQRPFVLSVATLERKKGLDTLIRAFRLVRDSYESDIALALVGPDGGLGAELRQLAKDLGLEDSVVFCGKVPHAGLHVYYAHATLFCLASRLEPFGIVVLEAGAFRLPVVATSVGGIQEVLEHEKSGRLVPVDDPGVLAREILDLLRAPSVRAKLGNELFEHVRRHFSWERAYRQYLELCGL